MDWSANSVHYLAMKELHETFLDYFLTTASNFAKKKDEGKCFFLFSTFFARKGHCQKKNICKGFQIKKRLENISGKSLL